jgi:hypothetical protein
MTSFAAPVPCEPRAPSLVARARSILLNPRSEWSVVRQEPSTIGGLYVGYIVWLAALGPVASVIVASIVGIRLPYGGSYRVPWASAVASASVRYVIALAMPYLLARIIDALATHFGGQRSVIQALKVAAYASTATWLANAIAIISGLSHLELLGGYSLYLALTGLPALMRAPRERAPGYTAAVTVAAAALSLLGSAIAARFVGFPLLSLPVR